MMVDDMMLLILIAKICTQLITLLCMLHSSYVYNTTNLTYVHTKLSTHLCPFVLHVQLIFYLMSYTCNKNGRKWVDNLVCT